MDKRFMAVKLSRTMTLTPHTSAVWEPFRVPGWLAAFLAKAGDAVLGVDPGFLIRYMNPAAEKLAGVRLAEAAGQHLLHVCRLETDGRPLSGREWDGFVASGSIPRLSLVGPEGAASTVTGSVMAISGAAGSGAGSLVLLREASDMARVEQAFLSTRASFHNVVEVNKDGIVIIDAGGTVRYANPAARLFIGCPGHDLVGGPLNLSLAPGEVQEIQISRENGDIGVGEVRVVPTVWEDKQALLASFRDITERKNLQEQLNQSQKMEAIGRLAAGVAHDFNNLLTLIRGSGQLMQFSMAEDDPNIIELSEIMNAVDRATALTTQLLALSRRQVLTPQVVDLNKVVTDLQKMLRRLIGEDIELATDLAAEPCTIKVDVVQTEQVILNLVINSRDAMPKGGRLTVRSRFIPNGGSIATDEGVNIKSGPQVMLQVSDTGCGISEKNLKHIFEPFFTTKARGKGTGLGLSTVYGIVHQSGGAISVKSQVGQGTTISICYPAAEDDETVPEPRPEIVRPHAGSETILVAEDEGAVRRLIMRILNLNGYRVIEAANGEEALKILRSGQDKVNMLLTDVVMPQLSGPELAKIAKAENPDLRILFVSGHGAEAVHRHKLKNMDGAFLRKPFLPADLTRLVRALLDAPAQDLS